MWGWARDERIINSYRELTVLEHLVLVGVVFSGFTLGFFERFFAFSAEEKLDMSQAASLLWWAALVIIVTRSSVFLISTHWPIYWNDSIAGSGRSFLMISGCSIAVFAILWFWGDNLAVFVTQAQGLARGQAVIGGFLIVVEQEIVFRLLLYYTLHRLTGRTMAFFGSVTFFAISHSGVTWPYLPLTFCGGAIFCLLMMRTGSIIPSIFIHSVI